MQKNVLLYQEFYWTCEHQREFFFVIVIQNRFMKNIITKLPLGKLIRILFNLQDKPMWVCLIFICYVPKIRSKNITVHQWTCIDKSICHHWKCWTICHFYYKKIQDIFECCESCCPKSCELVERYYHCQGTSY
jgi:hypothetical protein